MNPHQHPNCFRCRHLVITWERGRGYACRAMGFKSREIPWRVVLQSSGRPCLLYEPKPAPPGGAAGGGHGWII